MKEIKYQILDDIVSRIIHTVFHLFFIARFIDDPSKVQTFNLSNWSPDEPLAYECDLCPTSFESENELSKHIGSQHWPSHTVW